MHQLVIAHAARPQARFRLLLGLFIATAGLIHGLDLFAQWLDAHPEIARGFLSSLYAGLATGIGALPVLLFRRVPERAQVPLLALAAGMMLAACFFSLLAPALEHIVHQPAAQSSALLAAAALLAGAFAMQTLDGRLQHAHVEDIAPGSAPPRVGLVVAAIAIHHFPEGLAVGIASAAGADHGMTLGIALQNIPEGWIVASALILLGLSPWRAALAGFASGLIEPLGGLLGATTVSLAGTALPLALAAAAGAMLWVVVHELIPGAFRSGRPGTAGAGLLGGFALMLMLSALP